MSLRRYGAEGEPEWTHTASWSVESLALDLVEPTLTMIAANRVGTLVR